jgi:hypothetical protein
VEIRRIIEGGGIPLISITCNVEGVLHVEAVRATAKTSFFAVSHIWSRGLGNPQDNSLLVC